MAGRQDPRLEGETANETVRDATVSHLLFLLRQQTQTAQEVRRFLNEQVIPDLERQLRERLDEIEDVEADPAPVTTQRLQTLTQELGAIAATGTQQAGQQVADTLAELGQQEAEWQAGSINSNLSISFEHTMPSPEQVRDAAVNSPFDGLDLGSWYRRLGEKTRRDIDQAVRTANVEGETIRDVRQRIEQAVVGEEGGSVTNRMRQDAETIARSGVINASNRARQSFGEANSDIIAGWTWVATLDSRTCFWVGQPISTPDGDKPAGEVREGDYVVGGSGTPRRVHHVHGKRRAKTLRVRLSNGRSVYCTPDHQLLTAAGEWVAVEDLLEGTTLADTLG
jgi:hypothetical protein